MLYWLKNEWGENKLVKKPGMSKYIKAILEEVKIDKSLIDSYFGFLSLYKNQSDLTLSHNVCNLLEKFLTKDMYIVLCCPTNNWFVFATLSDIDYYFIKLYKVIDINVENDIYKKALEKRKEKNNKYKKVNNESKLIEYITNDEVILNRSIINRIVNKEIKKILKNEAFKVKKYIKVTV